MLHKNAASMQVRLNLFTKAITDTSYDNPSEGRALWRQALSAEVGEGNDNLIPALSSELKTFSLCAGNEFQPSKIKSRLCCHLDRKRHPYFILNPLKMEILSESPILIQFYDVLGNGTIEKILQMSGELRLASLLVNSRRTYDLTAKTSAGTVLSEEISVKIRQKSSMITELIMDEVDAVIQTVEYVYGRMLRTHSDQVHFKIFKVSNAYFFKLKNVGF